MLPVNTACMRSIIRTSFLNQNRSIRAASLGSFAAQSLIHSHLNPSNSLNKVISPIPPRDRDGDGPLHILSLDGGGVRGLSSLIILREFMARLEKIPGMKRPLIPADIFDLIVGTSTGGIAALMLGRLGMSVEEVLDVYQNMSGQIFSTGKFSTGVHAFVTTFMDGIPSMYNEDKLERIMKKIIATRTEHNNPEAPLEDRNSCPTAVIATRSADATRPVIMRSYEVPHDADPEGFKIWEAARATSAAPLYFRPVRAGGYGIPYLDGCVSGHSNPAGLAMQEAKYRWPDRKIGLFMSLGTGSPTRVPLQASIRDFISGFVYLSASTVYMHEMAWLEFKRKYEVSPYVRLSVDHEISKVRLDDPSMFENIISATLTYLEVARTSHKIQKCVELITGKEQSKLRLRDRPHEDDEDDSPEFLLDPMFASFMKFRAKPESIRPSAS